MPERDMRVRDKPEHGMKVHDTRESDMRVRDKPEHDRRVHDNWRHTKLSSLPL